MAIFGLNHGLTPFEKSHYFDFLKCCFYSLERLFFVLEYRKRHFPSLYSIKRKSKNWPFLEQNNGLTPFKKYPFFDFLNFMSLQRRIGYFLFQNIVKDIFLAFIALKKKLQKRRFLDQNHGLTPLKYCQFFDCLNFLFLLPRQAFFRSRIS